MLIGKTTSNDAPNANISYYIIKFGYDDMNIRKILTFIKDKYAYLLSFLLICFTLTYYTIAYLVSSMHDSSVMLYIAHKNKILAERVVLLSGNYTTNHPHKECITANLKTDLELLESSNKAVSCALNHNVIIKNTKDKIKHLYIKESIQNVDRYINLGKDLLTNQTSDKANVFSLMLDQVYGQLQTDLVNSNALYESELEQTQILLRNTEKLLTMIIWLIIIVVSSKYLHFFEVKPIKKKILIVEDNRISAEIVKKIIENQNYHPVVAGNGKEALDILELDRNYAMIFMDCEMPIMKGFECSSKIRSIEKEEGWDRIHIVALTASISDGDKEKCLNSGMDDYLKKPVHQSELIRSIKKWCK